MNGVKQIVKKELARVFSDKKLILSLFIIPVILIVGIFGLSMFMQSEMTNDIEEHQTIVVIQNAPEGFDQFIQASGFKGDITYLDKDQDIKEFKDSVLDGKLDLIITFEAGFIDEIVNYKEGNVVPEVKTYYNPSQDYSSSGRDEFVNTVLYPYQQKLLVDRIGNLDNIKIFNIDVDESSSIIVNEDKASGKMLGMILPYFITMMLFAGAMSLGVDAITGEKERGTLASMLITPLKRSEIVMGKLVSISILASMSAAVYAVSMIVAMPIMIKNMTEGSSAFTVNFTPIQIIELLVIMVALVFLYVTIVSLAAVFAKTSKEANTYVMPIYVMVIVAGMLTLFQSGKIADIYYAIPVYGSAISIQGLLTGDLTVVQLLLTLASTVGLTAILVAIISKAFNSEKVMFNA